MLILYKFDEFMKLKWLYKLEFLLHIDDDRLIVFKLVLLLYMFVAFMKLNNVTDTVKKLYKLELIVYWDDDMVIIFNYFHIIQVCSIYEIK